MNADNGDEGARRNGWAAKASAREDGKATTRGTADERR
jgi:hypothetical protein